MSKIKGTDSYLSVAGHLPCAFYSLSTGWWWTLDKNHYVLHQPDNSLVVVQDDLRKFEKGYIPFYKEEHINAFKSYLESST